MIASICWRWRDIAHQDESIVLVSIVIGAERCGRKPARGFSASRRRRSRRPIGPDAGRRIQLVQFTMSSTSLQSLRRGEAERYTARDAAAGAVLDPAASISARRGGRVDLLAPSQCARSEAGRKSCRSWSRRISPTGAHSPQHPTRRRHRRTKVDAYRDER